MVAVLEIAAGVNPIMFCSQCGTESTSQNAAFCTKCGAALVTVESEPRATGLEDRIKRLERERDHPANPGPDPVKVAEHARLWIEAGMEEPRAKAAALEFLEYCQATGQAPTFMALNMVAHEGDIEGGEDDDGPGNREEVVPKE